MPEPSTASSLPLIAMATSVLSLLVSGITLYVAQLRQALLTIVAGEYVNVSHFVEGNCSITLPVSLSNNGAVTATVQRLALLVRQHRAEDGYLLEPIFYQKLDERGNFQRDSQPVPIAVAGRGVETKQVQFRSSLDNADEFTFTRAGEYDFTVLAWLRHSTEPQSQDDFRITLSEADADILKKLRLEKSTGTVRLRQSEWRKWGAHKLTEVEVSALRTGGT